MPPYFDMQPCSTNKHKIDVKEEIISKRDRERERERDNKRKVKSLT